MTRDIDDRELSVTWRHSADAPPDVRSEVDAMADLSPGRFAKLAGSSDARIELFVSEGAASLWINDTLVSRKPPEER